MADCLMLVMVGHLKFVQIALQMVQTAAPEPSENLGFLPPVCSNYAVAGNS